MKNGVLIKESPWKNTFVGKIFYNVRNKWSNGSCERNRFWAKMNWWVKWIESNLFGLNFTRKIFGFFKADVDYNPLFYTHARLYRLLLPSCQLFGLLLLLCAGFLVGMVYYPLQFFYILFTHKRVGNMFFSLA